MMSSSENSYMVSEHIGKGNFRQGSGYLSGVDLNNYPEVLGNLVMIYGVSVKK